MNSDMSKWKDIFFLLNPFLIFSFFKYNFSYLCDRLNVIFSFLNQATIMKFAVLALTLLLAVGEYSGYSEQYPQRSILGKMKYEILFSLALPKFFLFLFTQVVPCNFGFNFLLFNLLASQAAVVPGEEPSDMQLRYTAFKDMVEQVKNMLDRAIVNSPDSQELHTP